MKKQRIAVAYSGGLDTSVIVKWLQEKYNADIVTVTGNLGQKKELAGVPEKAYKTGAKKVYVQDLRDEFVEDYIFPAGRFEILEERLREQVTRAIVTPEAFPDAPSYFIVQSAVSPDARSVAYVRYSPGRQRVYVSAVAGSRPVLLTDGADAGPEDGPVWSPDGRWILYVENGRLMKALASGGTRGKVLAEDAVFTAQRPRWLADGRGVIYLSTDGLKQVSAEGGAAHLVSRERPALWDTSPDG